MITKTTAANFDEFYAPRFAEITEALHEAGYTGIEVNSLESYFGNLVAIGSLETSKGVPGKYLVVPFDEPYFEIDANTRTITVPDHFKKYGVGVYGDNLAELLIFKIDRYFDHQDLFNTKIAINWSFTPKGSRNPIYGTPQLAFAPDDELEPGYVLFGFYVMRDMAKNVDGELTSGTLNFAISFYDDTGDNEELRYSFNTLPASVAINEGLELKDPSQVKDLGRALIARLKDSAYTPDGIIPLDNPVWMSGDTVLDPVSGEQLFLGLPSLVNFHMNDDGTEDDELVLNAQAYGDAMSTIKYAWFTGYDENTILEARPIDSFIESSDFTATADTAPVDGKVYYIGVKEIAGDAARQAAFNDLSKVILEIKNGEAKITNDSEVKEGHFYYEHVADLDNMVKVSDASTLAALFADELTEYELGTSLTVTQAGTYSVRAQAVREVHQSSGSIPAEEVDDGSLKIKVKVIPAADVTEDAARPNQGKCEVLQEDNSAVIIAKISELDAFASSNPAQGTHKWVALDLETNVNDIKTLTWGGEQLTQADVDDSTALNLGAGHIVFYAKADELENNPRTIRIGKGSEVVELKVSFTDSASKSVLETLIAENNIANIQQDNVITVKSNAINSNVCTVPSAAIPEVTLSVETSLGDDFDIINPDVAGNFTYISSESAPIITAVVTSSSEQPLGAIALEALASDNIPELTAEEIIANTKSESNPEGKYEFELLEDGQKQVNANGVVSEGEYVVRAINRRNHSYAVSTPSQVVRTSFVAPAINGVTVKTVDGGTEVVLVDKGHFPAEAPEGAFIRLNSNYPTRRFYIVDESTNNIAGAETSYTMEEVIRTANGGYEKKSLADEHDNTVEYEIINNECVIDDEGIYRVRIENIYNGTRRVAYTDVFEVLRLA